jgi:hypothetical protein
MKFGTNSLTLLVKNKTLSHHFPMLNNFVTIDIRAMGKNSNFIQLSVKRESYKMADYLTIHSNTNQPYV